MRNGNGRLQIGRVDIGQLLHGLITAAVCFVAWEVRTLRIDITRIRTELDIAKPSDVLREVRLLKEHIQHSERFRSATPQL